jgi:hypothetical protein
MIIYDSRERHLEHEQHRCRRAPRIVQRLDHRVWQPDHAGRAG